MKSRKNIGIANLTKLNVDNITKGANLIDNSSKEKNTSSIATKKEKPKKVARLINLPEKLDSILVNAKDSCKITGGIASYIVLATREKMERDGLV